MALYFGLAWFATELASQPQRMSSLICRSNYHQQTDPFHRLTFEDCSAKFPWTSCKSSLHGPLTKGAMGMSWSLSSIPQSCPLGLRVDRRHQGARREARRTCFDLALALKNTCAKL